MNMQLNQQKHCISQNAHIEGTLPTSHYYHIEFLAITWLYWLLVYISYCRFKNFFSFFQVVLPLLSFHPLQKMLYSRCYLSTALELASFSKQSGFLDPTRGHMAAVWNSFLQVSVSLHEGRVKEREGREGGEEMNKIVRKNCYQYRWHRDSLQATSTSYNENHHVREISKLCCCKAPPS